MRTSCRTSRRSTSVRPRTPRFDGAPAMTRILPVVGILFAVSGAATGRQPSTGRLVFIGTYTGEKTGSKGIYAFRFDEATGALTPLGLKAETPSPSFLATNAAGTVLYAVNEVG